MIYEYSEENNEIIIYKEDANEFLKEEDFEQRKTWQRFKKMREKNELKLVKKYYEFVYRKTIKDNGQPLLASVRKKDQKEEI